MPTGVIEQAKVAVPYRDTVENGDGMSKGYCELWRAIFSRLAFKANAGEEIELKEIKKLVLLSTQVTSLTDLKKIKQQFADYKDLMATILSRKGKIPKEDIVAAL